MSKGVILGHLGEGRYLVRQELAIQRIKDEITRLSERIAKLATDLPAAQVALIEAEDAVKDVARKIDLLIPDYRAGVDGARKQIVDLQRELVPLQSAARQAQIKVSDLTAENLAALKRRNLLQSIPEGRELEAWCADYTLDLSGTVGLVDVNDEGGQGVIIQPGFNGAADYDRRRDGALFPALAQTGIQTYFNAALLPGVQKWLPRYRVGVITSISGDVCNVTLDAAASSAQALPINVKDVLAEVPILYMDCDGAAFQTGDRVLVRFTQSGPLIVGFEREPVPCSLFGFVFEPARYAGVQGTNYTAVKETYGKPFDDVNGPINYPLGTVSGTDSAWTALPNGGQLFIERGKARNYGNKNWFNSDKLVLSWSGPPGRAHRLDQYDPDFSGFKRVWKTRPYVFHDLDIILDLTTEAAAGDFDHVLGAAVHTDIEGSRWLIVVASDNEFIPLDVRDSLPGQTFKVFRVAVDGNMQPTGAPEFLHQYTMPVEMMYQSHFYFSEDGTKAVCTIVGDLLDPDNLHIDLLRYDLQSGFSVEQIWSRAQPIGSRSRTSTWAQENNTGTGGLLTKTGTLTVNYQAAPHSVPIYCDFVGNDEVIAYEVRPAVNSNVSARYDFEEGSFDYSREHPAPISEWSGSRSASEARSAPFSVVTSAGRVLFQMPFTPQENSNFQYDYFSVATVSGSDANGSFVQPGYGTFTLSNSVTAQVGGIDWEENLLAIDIRFEFCAVAYGGYDYDLNESISTSSDNPDFSTGGVQASGSISGNEIVEVVEVWMGGSLHQREEALRLAGPIEISAYSQDPIAVTGINASNESVQETVYPELPLKIGSPYLLTAAGYRSGVHAISSVGMNYRTSSTTRKPILLQHVSGYQDPVDEILERNLVDGYLLCSVGLV